MKYLPLFAVFCLLSLSACGRSSPTNYYLLESSPGLIQADGMQKKTLRIAQVDTPAYLNRNNIISRVAGETRLVVAEFHLWAEPVSNGARRVVEEVLTEPLLEKGVYVLPAGTEEHGDYVLVIDIERLDGNFDEKAVLKARWTLLNSSDKPVDRGIYTAEEMVPGANYNILVAVESRLLAKFANHMAGRLPAMLGK